MKSFQIIVFLFFSRFILLSCANPEPAPVHYNHQTVFQKKDIVSDCELNGTLSPEERRNISLFKVAKKIQVVSFSQKVVRRVPIDHHQIVSKYLRDEITLTEDQVDQLTEVLYNYNYSKSSDSRTISHGDCYEPRHAIVFLNSSGKVFGYFEFCFECDNHQTVPAKEYIGEYCNGKYRLIEQFFQSVGVTFFKEE